MNKKPLRDEIRCRLIRLRMGDNGERDQLQHYAKYPELRKDILDSDEEVLSMPAVFLRGPLSELIELPAITSVESLTSQYDYRLGRCCHCGRPALSGDNVCYDHNPA